MHRAARFGGAAADGRVALEKGIDRIRKKPGCTKGRTRDVAQATVCRLRDVLFERLTSDVSPFSSIVPVHVAILPLMWTFTSCLSGHGLHDAVSRFGRVDVLVNNADVVGPSPLLSLADYPMDELERVLAANVLGPLRLVQRVLPRRVSPWEQLDRQRLF